VYKNDAIFDPPCISLPPTVYTVNWWLKSAYWSLWKMQAMRNCNTVCYGRLRS